MWNREDGEEVRRFEEVMKGKGIPGQVFALFTGWQLGVHKGAGSKIDQTLRCSFGHRVNEPLLFLPFGSLRHQLLRHGDGCDVRERLCGIRWHTGSVKLSVGLLQSRSFRCHGGGCGDGGCGGFRRLCVCVFTSEHSRMHIIIALSQC